MKNVCLIFIVSILFSFSAKADYEEDTTEYTLPESYIRSIPDSMPDTPKGGIKKSTYSGAHRKYLSDPLDIKKTRFAIAGKSTAVIANTKTALFDSPAGNKIALIPFGEIVEAEDSGFPPSEFENCYNTWYKTTYKGKSGFIFGANIINEYYCSNSGDYDSSNLSTSDKINLYSFYAKQKEKREYFTDMTGISKLDPEIEKRIKRDRIAFEFTELAYPDGNYIDNDRMDDMFKHYSNLKNNSIFYQNVQSSFVTTDFIAHSLHLLFDGMLENSEMTLFFPAMKKLTERYSDEIAIFAKENKSPELNESIESLKRFFLVANSLSGGFDPADKTALKELLLITKSSGFSESPIFKHKEDYSLFRPRGHYNKRKDLQDYFRLMTWYGKISFICDMKDDSYVNNTRMALILTKIAAKNKDILKLWNAVHSPVTYLVGDSNGYVLGDFIPLIKYTDDNNFNSWISDKKNIDYFLEKASGKIKPMQISAVSAYANNIKTNDKTEPLIVFRFFGQSVTIDGIVQQMLCSPKVGTNTSPRNMIKGLDLMGVYGSAKADMLLSEDKKKYLNYEKNYNTLREKIFSFSDADWRKTYYLNHINMIRSLLDFAQNENFYFTNTPAYNTKSLITAHGSWAELRHDTILYQEQVCAEMGGGSEMTWNIEKVAPAINYIEPNLDFYYRLDIIISDLLYMGNSSKFISAKFKTKLEAFHEVVKKLTLIAEKESRDEPVSSEENMFIYNLPYNLWEIVQPETYQQNQETDKRMAVIADVHTDPVSRNVLEVGIGQPYKIYVALNDGQGGKRIAVGYTFSYYEFRQPMSKRLTDEEWKKAVYGHENTDLDSLMPEWCNAIFK